MVKQRKLENQKDFMLKIVLGGCNYQNVTCIAFR